MNYYVALQSGHKVYFDDPRDFDWRDQAISLPRLARWGGQTSRPWSVGQHVLVMVELVRGDANDKALRPRHMYNTLLHEFAEPIIGDNTRPILKYIPALEELKRRIEAQGMKEFEYTEDSLCKYWDDQMLWIESEVFDTYLDVRHQDVPQLPRYEINHVKHLISLYEQLTSAEVQKIWTDHLHLLRRELGLKDFICWD